MARIAITTRDGERVEVDAPDGDPLMETLRDENLGVEGICGGCCSCGTCHVYVADSWQAQAGERVDDEEMMLEAIGDLVEVRPSSRLSCQIIVGPELDGLEITIGPVA